MAMTDWNNNKPQINGGLSCGDNGTIDFDRLFGTTSDGGDMTPNQAFQRGVNSGLPQIVDQTTPDNGTIEFEDILTTDDNIYHHSTPKLNKGLEYRNPFESHVVGQYGSMSPMMNQPDYQFLVDTKPGAVIPTTITYHGIQYTITNIDETYYHIGDVYTVYFRDDESNPMRGCILSSIEGSVLVFKRIDLENDSVMELRIDAKDIANNECYIVNTEEVNTMMITHEVGFGYNRR